MFSEVGMRRKGSLSGLDGPLPCVPSPPVGRGIEYITVGFPGLKPPRYSLAARYGALKGEPAGVLKVQFGFTRLR